MSVASLRDKHPIGSMVRVVGGEQIMAVMARISGSRFASCVWTDAGGHLRCADFHDDDLIPVKDD